MARSTRLFVASLIALLSLLLGGSSPADAQVTSTWNGTTGNWSDFTKWSTDPEFPNNGNGGFDYNAIIDGGTVTLDQDIVISALSGNGGTVLLDDDNLLTVGDSSSTTFSGAIQGSGSLTKVGSGGLTLAGNKSYTGVNTITGGTLSGATIANSGSNSSFGAGSGFSISNGGTLDYTGISTASTDRSISLGTGGGTIAVTGSGGFLALNGVVSGDGGLTKTGQNLLRLNNAANSYSGATVIEGGELIGATIADSGTNSSFGSGNNFSISNGARLQYTGGSGSTDRTLSLGTGGGWISINNSTATINWTGDIAGPGRLTLNGGTLALSGNNTSTGGTTIFNGKIRLSAANLMSAAGVVTVNGLGILDLNNFHQEIGALAGSGSVLLGNAMLTTGEDNTSTSFSGTISGTGGLEKIGSGTLTLSGNNSYIGTTINGGTLRSATIANSGSNSPFGQGNFSIGNGGTLEFSGSNGSTNRTISLGTGGGVIAVTAGKLVLDGVIDGAGGLTKSGSGTLTLSVSNAYTGGTSIVDGTLQLAKTYSTPTPGEVSVNSGGALAINAGGAEEWTAGTSGGGTIGGLITGTGGQGIDDQIAWNAGGRLGIDVSNAPGNLLAYSGAIGNFRSGIGTTRNDVGVTKLGSGTLALLGNNTYSGGTTVLGGTLAFARTASMPAVGEISVSNGATLAIYAGGSGEWTSGTSGGGTIGGLIAGSGGQGTANQIAWNSGSNLAIDTTNALGGLLTYGGVIGNFRSGTSTTRNDVGLTKLGPGSLTLTGNNSYSGITTISGGTLSGATIANSGSNSSFGSGSSFSISNGGTLDYTGTSTASTNRSISLGTGGGTFAVTGSGGFLVLQGIVSGAGGLTKTGPNILRLNNTANSYSGANVIEGGEIAGATIADSGTSSSFGAGISFWISNGARLQYTGGSASTNRTLSLGTGGGWISINNEEAIINWSGDVTGPGSLTLNGGGKLALSGNNTYAGGTTIFNGTLAFNGSLNGPVTVMNLGTLSGTGTVLGNVSGVGRVAPGNSPGILAINGDYTQAESSVLEIEVQGYAPGTEHDQVQVSGTTILAGRLEVPILQPFNPGSGPILNQPIQFLTTAARSGEFNAIVSPNLDALYPGLAIDVTYQSDGAQLAFVPKKTNVVFDDAADANADWFDSASTWEDTDNPGTPVLPTLVHDISIANVAAMPQTVEVESANAFVAKLAVGGGAEDMTVMVGNGSSSAINGNLSSTLNVTVLDHGVIALNAGTLATSDVLIEGGVFRGNGLLDLSSDTSVGSGSLVVSSGLITPGFSVGRLDIDGDVELGVNAEVLIEVDSSTSADMIAITGSAELGGTLTVAIPNDGSVQPGDFITVITADSFNGTEFDDVFSVGNDDLFFVPRYLDDQLALFCTEEGDMDQLGGVDQDDISAFALALTDPAKYDRDYDENARTAGDIDDDGDCDVDDIDDFAALLGMSVAALVERMQAVSEVPEPSVGSLLAVLALAPLRMRWRST